MGERDFRSTIKNAIESIGKELDIQIDVKDHQTIHLQEVVQCLRRSYYDRTQPLRFEREGFNELLGGLLQKYGYGSKPKKFDIDNDNDKKITLRGQADMIVDDTIILFRSADKKMSDPPANDVLFLNACLWIYNKFDGIIVYILADNKQEMSFSVTRNKKMFEETVRRIRVLNNLLDEQKIPILEPSPQCDRCQYYQRCYLKKRVGRSISLKEMIGMESKDD